jgi:cytoskeletal protein CcmA (bactofilin family)
MKYIASVALAFTLLLPVWSVEASTIVRTGEAVSVTDDQHVDGNFYILAGTASLAGPVKGDVVAAAGTVSINAPVEHDVLVIGGTVGVNASVTEDVRIVAGDVTLAAPVGGSVFVMGGRLKILSTATIAGDVLFMGGEATIEGEVRGQILGVAERVRIDSKVGQGVDVSVVTLVVGDKADISGAVQYTSTNELERAPGAIITGEITRSDVVAEAESTNPYRSMAMGFLVSLFASLSLYAVARRLLDRCLVRVADNALLESLIGTVTLVMVPMAIVLLMVSVLGLFLGLIGLALFLLTLILAIPLLNMSIGLLIAHTFTSTKELNILYITLGALTVQALLIVPIIGPVLLFVCFAATIGAVVSSIYQMIRSA